MLHDFKCLPQCKWDLHTSGMSRGVDWLFIIGVSGKPIGPIFKGQAAQVSVVGLLEP